MTWESFFLGCFVFGFVLSLIAFLAGSSHLHWCPTALPTLMTSCFCLAVSSLSDHSRSPSTSRAGGRSSRRRSMSTFGSRESTPWYLLAATSRTAHAPRSMRRASVTTGSPSSRTPFRVYTTAGGLRCPTLAYRSSELPKSSRRCEITEPISQAADRSPTRAVRGNGEEASGEQLQPTPTARPPSAAPSQAASPSEPAPFGHPFRRCTPPYCQLSITGVTVLPTDPAS